VEREMKNHICGIYGSGKSSLAKILSKELGIKNYALDDIKYKVKYSQILPVEKRIKKLQDICSLPEWITEGTWSNYAEDAFKKADIIILMNTSKSLCVYRILKRYLLRKKQEKDTFRGSLKLARAVFKYHFTKDPVSLYAHKSLIKKYKKKLFIIRKKSEISDLIKKLKKK
jgi:adenylate kinase family enzyme